MNDRHVPPHGPDGTSSTVEDLQRLAELRDAGVLSEDEFVTAKSNVLGLPTSDAVAAGPVPEPPRTRLFFRVAGWGLILLFGWILATVVFGGSDDDGGAGESVSSSVELGTDVASFTAVSPAMLRVNVRVTNNTAQHVSDGVCAFSAMVAGRDVSKFFDSGGTFDRALSPGEDFVLLATIGVKDQQAAYVDGVQASCSSR